MPEKPMPEQPTIRVWDLPVRIFHWTLTALVVIAYATAEAEGPWFAAHLAAGYGAMGLVAFRLVWGIVGTRHARFAAFVRRWPAVRAHAAAVLRFRPPRTIGHNPIGGWMIVALLATVALLVATGLFAGEEAEAGPFAALAGPRLADALGEVHEALNSLLWTLVVVHVAGVVGESLLTGENLVRAMWTGRKEILTAADAAEDAGGVRAVPLALALVVAVAVVAAVVA